MGFQLGSINRQYNSLTETFRYSFNLTHKGDSIFHKEFDGSSTSEVLLGADTFVINNHFYVTGEPLHYEAGGGGTAIGIDPTIGIGNTLPERVFAIKIDENKIKVAETEADAHSGSPINIITVGAGTTHSFTAEKQNSKCIIALDNMIQSPLYQRPGYNTVLTGVNNRIITVENAQLFKNYDLIKIDDEVLRILVVGFQGNTNDLLCDRGWMGTRNEPHAAGSTVELVLGDYNIVDDILTFADVPFGGIKFSAGISSEVVDVASNSFVVLTDLLETGSSVRLETLDPPEPLVANEDYFLIRNQQNNYSWAETRDDALAGIAITMTSSGIGTHTIRLIDVVNGSSFQGRSFIRSDYTGNIVMDDLSQEFTGIGKTFTLTSAGVNTVGITSDYGVLLVNNVFQKPDTDYEFIGGPVTGITSIEYTGNSKDPVERYSLDDVNANNLPRRGLIVTLGNSQGFGYQPQYTAIGTATVSAAGTISNVWVKYDGSGYINGPTTYEFRVAGAGSTVSAGGTFDVADGHVDQTYLNEGGQGFYTARDISDFDYDHTSGIATITAVGHELKQGNTISLAGISLTCYYSPGRTITNADYDGGSGIMTVTTSSDHGFSLGKDVVFDDIRLTCAYTAPGGSDAYPRTTDPYYNGTPVLEILSPTQFKVQVGQSTVEAHSYHSGGFVQGVLFAPRGGDYAGSKTNVIRVIDNDTFTCQVGTTTERHYYKRGGKLSKPVKCEFDAPVPYDDLQLISSSTGIGASVSVTINDAKQLDKFNLGNIGFGYTFREECTIAGIPTTPGLVSHPIQSGGAYNHTFVGAIPYALISGGEYEHETVSIEGNSLRDGSWNGSAISPTDVSYNPTTGDVEYTLAGHSLTTSDSVGIRTGSMVLKCSMDGKETLHSYPRASDPVAGVITSITGVTTDTFTVNVGASQTVGHLVSGATYDATTGDMVMSIGSHTLRGGSTHSLTTAAYNPNTGIITCTISNHGFTVGERIKFVDESLTFKCAKDNYGTEHNYPRSSDPYSNQWLSISNITANSFEVEVLKVTPSTNVSDHIFQESSADCIIKGGESLRFMPESITFTCDMDGNASEHSYPRSTDPFYNTACPIVSVAGTTVTLNVGRSPHVQHRVNDATYSGDTGLLSLDIGSHSLKTGTNVFVRDNSLWFTCAKDEYGSAHSYPRSGIDQISGIGTEITSIGGSTIELDVGMPEAGERYTHEYLGSDLEEPKFTISEVRDDEFAGWVLGKLQILDDFSHQFNGRRRTFTIHEDGKPLSIEKLEGSPISLEDVLLIFINDILQDPGVAYTFDGGTRLTFTEPPVAGSSLQILFYRGTDSDVSDSTSLQTVKPGDKLTIQKRNGTVNPIKQDGRIIRDIISRDSVLTTLYNGVGISSEPQPLRPVTWCKQTEDMIISGIKIHKTRDMLRSRVRPVTRLIQGISSTTNTFYGYGGSLVFSKTEEPDTAEFDIKIVDENAEDTSTIETVTGCEVLGDEGIITGVGCTADALQFEFYIPLESPLRINEFGGILKTGISTGDYFVVSNSNVGSGVTAVGVGTTSVIGVATSFLDSVYQVSHLEVVGTGKTMRIHTNVQDNHGLSFVGLSSGAGNTYGSFSWAKFTSSRAGGFEQSVTTNNGLVGLSTAPQLIRTTHLLDSYT